MRRLIVLLLLMPSLLLGQAVRSLTTTLSPDSLHSRGMRIFMFLRPFRMMRFFHSDNSLGSMPFPPSLGGYFFYLLGSSMIIAIQSAFGWRNPAAISGLVMAFIIYAIQEKPWIRFGSDITKKCGKGRSPFSANGDTLRAIPRVASVAGKIASIFHISPSRVFGRCLSSRRVSVLFHKAIIVCFLGFVYLYSADSYGQAVRFNSNVYTINASAPQPGALYPVLASASATVAVCNAPATGFTVLNAATNSISGNCTNYATTYTNAAQTGTCSAPTQLTRTNSTACVGNVDPEGGFGAWLAAGTYQYTVTLSYGSFGPYDFTVGGTGGGGGGGTPVGFGAQQYSNLAASAFANGGVYNTDQYATGAGTGQGNFFSSSNCIASGSCHAFLPPTSTDTTQTGLGFSSSKNSFFEHDYRKNSMVTDALNPQIGYSGVAIPNVQAMYTDILNYTEQTPSSNQSTPQYFVYHLMLNGSPGFSNGQAPCGSGSFLFCANPPYTGAGSWALHSGELYTGTINGSGINNLKNSIFNFAGTGDSQEEASFDNYAGGCVAPSDECHHWKSVHLDTLQDFFGTLTTIISSGSANPSSPSPMTLTVTPTAGPWVGTQGQGRFLQSETAVVGTDSTPLTTAIVSLIRRPGDTYPYGTLVTQTANLPNSPAAGTLINDCTVPVQNGGVAIGSNGASGPGNPGTAGCAVTVTSGQFCAVGSWTGSACSGTTVVPVCMAANKWNMFDIGVLLNSVTALSGGQQTLVGTMHRSVPAGGFVFQGGLCGTVMNAQGDTNNNSGTFISGSTFPFIGSFGGNTAVYLNYAASDVWQPIPNPGSQWGSRDTGNSIAHLGFTAINLTRASGVVTATITSGYQNSPQSRLMLNGAIFFSVTGCADNSFNSTAIQNFGYLTGPFPNVFNQNQATFTYAQAGPDASGTCPTANIAMQNTSIGIFPAAEVYDVQNHTSGLVDGFFATSYQPAFQVGQTMDEPTHYQAGMNGVAVSNEVAQPLGAGSTSYSSVEHNSASFTGADFQCNNIPISFQVFSGGGTGQPLPCLHIFGPRLDDIVTDSAPFNGGAVIAVGPPQTAYNWSVNVPQFRNYVLFGLDAVSNIYRAAIGFDDDTEAFQFRFDSALGYNPSISFSPTLSNFALPKGGSFAIPVRVPELQFVSNSAVPMAHIKQCAPLSPTLAVSTQLCYATDVPTAAVVTTNTPGSTQWIYILQVNDVAGPAYGTAMFLNNGPATLSGSVFNSIPCSDLPAGFTGIIWEFTNPLFNEVGTCPNSGTILHDTGTYSQSVGPNGTIAGAILGSGGFEATGLLGGFYFSQSDIYGTTTPAETITAGISQKSTGTLSIDTTAQGNSLGNLVLNNLTVNSCTGCGSGTGGVTSINTVTGAFTFTGSGVSCTSTTCTFSGTGTNAWSALTNPTGNLALTMRADTSTFTFNATTGTSDLFKWTDTASNTGTGIMGHFTTASGSTEIPWQADSNGVGFQVAANGNLSSVGGTTSGALQLSGSTSGTATFTVNAIAGTPTLLAPAQSGTLIAANAEVVSFSSTPVFSNAYNVSRIVLTGNITSFTMNSAIDGGQKTLCFEQGVGPYTVTPPASVHGFFTIGTVNGDWNCQSFVYDNTDSIWLASTPGVINQ